MNLNNDILFNISGCLTNTGMQKYLKNELSAASLKLIEDHLSTCEFCRDAVEGYREMGSDQESKTANMLLDIDTRIHLKQSFLMRKRKANISLVMSIAASLVLFFGVFYMLENKQLGGRDYLAFIESAAMTPIDSIDIVPIKVKLEQPISELTYIQPKPLKVASSQHEKRHRQKDVMKLVEYDDVQDEVDLLAENTASVEERVEKQVQKRTTQHITYVQKDQGSYDTESEVQVGEKEKEAEATIKKKDVISTQSAAPAKSNSRFVNGKYNKLEAFNAQQPEKASIKFKGDFDVPPRFKGNDGESFSDYIYREIESAYKNKGVFTTEVKFGFVINEAGMVVEPIILKGGTSDFNESMIEILKLSPEWQPGLLDTLVVPVGVDMKLRFN